MYDNATALLLVDLQVDFMPTGMLPVAEGDAVVPLANALMPRYRTVVATQDWHPANHLSFAANHPWRKPGQVIDLEGLPQVLWPIHCVQDTWGAEFVDGLDTSGITEVFQKGTDPTIDSYSGFYDNGHRKSTGLADWLRERGIEEVHVMGLATDYCVKFTVLDALKEGFRVVLIEDATRGVELTPGDVVAAVREMRTAGARIARYDELG
ncbi:bifunctional nicotinamidase/pyrazinamidase [Lewinella sp. JB7]|uniref:bifunctional nicotinamidase/pyrazinamidase n=1 Tax=Lewinella sp. JB7 TaxID=2962887 RepID=UPI0020C9D3E5|nr:bifunctional nicotinamidase/pyrazinamidase [Lewinella sp. JB7]MCP9235189.1 bifunctional nicotinamidase/pyrazinamidase [Lewinella sp. JB7]